MSAIRLSRAVAAGAPRRASHLGAVELRVRLQPSTGILARACGFQGTVLGGGARAAVAGLAAAATASATFARRGLARRHASSSVGVSDFRQGMGEAAASGVRGGMDVILVPCLNDNYAPIFHDAATGCTAVVDTPEVEPILSAIEEKGWKLTHVLNTHHHSDHCGGNLELKKRTGCTIVGPAAESIPGVDVSVKDGDAVQVGSFAARVLDVGGHTAGHIAYHFEKQNVAFVGDALFVLGCGRLFEGTPAQMWASLLKIRGLPPDTVIYCAHEYTESNARFALELQQALPRLRERVDAIKHIRSESRPTVPTILGHELETNPFLRADSDELREAAKLPKGAPPVEVFAEVRRMKDNF